MKKDSLLSLLLIVLFLSGVAVAQSGRRIKNSPAPSGTPSQTRTDTETRNAPEDQPTFSESTPAVQLPVFSSRRNKPNSDKNKKDKIVGKTPAVTPAATPEAVGDDEVLKVDTSLISIPVSVYDRNGIYVPGLAEKDFKIFEDGKEQEIAYFGTSDKPFTVILLLDTSPSTEYKIEQIQQAAMNFVKQLKPADNVMVIEFNDRVRVLTEITNNRALIDQAIQKADFGGGTSLYDAVDFSLRKRLNKIEGRKAIVLFTDGVDTTSRKADFESTIADAEEAEAVIFPIYYNTYLDQRGIGGGGLMGSVAGAPGMGGGNSNVGQGNSAEEYARGRSYLNFLAAATGGRVYRPESTPGGLDAAFEGIAEELRRQYSIGYYPQETGQAGQRKQIKVRVERPNVVVRARDSYIVGSSSQAQTGK